MKITGITLEKLTAFKLSGIKRLEMTCTSALQIVLGTNGSGKSNLLLQLSPNPPGRSDYEDKETGEAGKRTITIEDNGSLYTLTSDFSNHKSPHSFIRDGEELNEGGTTGLQQDLVKFWLNYSPLTETLCRVGFDLCGMSSVPRKTLLLQLNPFNMMFILERYKKVASQVRACKNNLNMLAERKGKLETQLLDESLIQELSREYTESVDEERRMVECRAMVTQEKSTHLRDNAHLRGTGHENNVETVIGTAQRIIKAVGRESPFFKDVNRDDPDRQLDQTISSLGFMEGTIARKESELAELIHELETHKSSMQEITETEAATEIRLRIKGIEDELVDLKQDYAQNPIPESEIKSCLEQLPLLKETLSKFIDCPIQLMSQKTIRLKRDKLFHIDMLSQQLMRERSQVSGRIEYLEKSRKLRLSDIPQTNCAGMECPLYANFRLTHDAVVAELEQKTQRLASIDHFFARAKPYMDAQVKQLDAMEPYVGYITTLIEIIGNCPAIKPIFSNAPMIGVLQKSPMVYAQRVQDFIERSMRTHRIKDLDIKLFQEQLHLEKSTSATDSERSRLKTLIDVREEKIFECRRDLESSRTKHMGFKYLEGRIRRYKELTHALEMCQRKVDTALQYHQAQQHYQLIQILEEDITTRLNELHVRVREISGILREQDILRARYTEEVMAQISTIEHRKKEWEHVEYALDRIPHERMVKFLNRMISIMNAFIAQVWTYEFKILPMDPDKKLDYTFPYTIVQDGNKARVPDIKFGSKAQKAMINIAFNFAIRKIQHLENYPLFLDEVGDEFDNAHKHTFLNLLKMMVDEEVVSQIFLVNHHAVMHEGLINSETLVLNDNNVITPANYNLHAKFVKAI